MTSLKSKQAYSRQKARKKVKEIYPKLSLYYEIHHIDEDPFNNDIHNLSILNFKTHSILHGKKPLKIPIGIIGSQRKSKAKQISKDFAELKSRLIIYNSNL